MAQRLPAVFFGHGNPMNALAHNAYTEVWSALGAQLPRPRAVLAISAHWYVPGAHVTASPAPRTIHDFGGFPRELYEVEYPAPGDPQLASRVIELLAGTNVVADRSEWGLDHGTWSVLKHVYSQADIPVVQLSIDGTQPLAYHHAMAKSLAALRDVAINSLNKRSANGSLNIRSGCHCTPTTQLSSPVHSTPSIVPSVACAITRRFLPGSRIAW